MNNFNNNNFNTNYVENVDKDINNKNSNDSVSCNSSKVISLSCTNNSSFSDESEEENNIKCKKQTKGEYDSIQKQYFDFYKNKNKKIEEIKKHNKELQKTIKSLKSEINLFTNTDNIEFLTNDLEELYLIENNIQNKLKSISNKKKEIVLKYKRHSYEKYTKQEDKCIICYELPCNILLNPCKHLLACEFCSNKIVSCPKCRAYVEYKTKVNINAIT